jgi:hypothetical protein
MKGRLIVSFLMTVFLLSFVSALDGGYCATAEVISINPSSVGVDEDFNVGILIDNCGSNVPEEMIFEITRYSQDIEIKEPLITNIGKMGYANSERFILYHMHSSPDATPGEHIFETKLTYGRDSFSEEKEGNFSVTVNTKEPDLTISRIYTNPEIVYSGEKVILTIDVENSGNGEAKDVRMEIKNLELAGIKQKYLGKIESDESLPARFVLETDDSGIFDGIVEVSYDFGGKINRIEFPMQIQIFSKGINKLWIFSIVLILGVFGYFLLRKRAKS